MSAITDGDPGQRAFSQKIQILKTNGSSNGKCLLDPMETIYKCNATFFRNFQFEARNLLGIPEDVAKGSRDSLFLETNG